jgi:lipopolysaccharide export system permease protein
MFLGLKLRAFRADDPGSLPFLAGFIPWFIGIGVFFIILAVVVGVLIAWRKKEIKNVLIISMVFCIGAAALFYIMQMVTMLLAKFGWIPPLAGAWTPVIFFTTVSVVLLKYAKT